MLKRKIKELIAKGEGLTIEFKEARAHLPNNFFETVCAFLNGFGGDILLGVNDKGKITGVDVDKINEMKVNISNLSNNPNKLNPPFMLFPEEIEIDGRWVIYIRVPQSSQVHNSANIVYDRSTDGDFKVTTHAGIQRIYIRKNNYFTENKIYPFLQFSDFDEKVFIKVRNLMRSHRPEHPWLALSNEDMLKMAGFYKRDFETGKTGFTLASALLFGKDDVIQQIIPYYKTDALLRRSDPIHYDDRREIRTNLIDSYDQLMEFIRTYLPDKFYLEGDVRVDLREKIFREVVANILIHREYLNAFQARMIIYQDRFEAENAHVPVRYGPINPDDFNPYPKNPTIVKFFQQIGRAEELGSGMRNIQKYLPLYARKSSFKFIEEDHFKTILYLGSEEPDKVGYDHREKSSEKGSEKGSEKSSEKILQIIAGNPNVSAKEMAEAMGISPRAVEKQIAKLKKSGTLKRIGPAKGGYWKIVKKK